MLTLSLSLSFGALDKTSLGKQIACELYAKGSKDVRKCVLNEALKHTGTEGSKVVNDSGIINPFCEKVRWLICF